MKNIVFENVKKAYGKNVVVEDLCMEVKEGERLILLGPSGCGKSTTLRMIAGLENVTAGNLWMRDQVVNDVPCGERGVSMVFQNYALFPHMSVKNNIIYGLKAHKMDENEINARLKEVLKMLELEGLEDRKPKELSGGQRQRVALARAVVKRADYFLLDEPLSNLDAQLRMRARKELVKIHEMYHPTLVYVTHDQIEAMTVGDRIALMYRGKMEMLDTPSHVYNRPASVFCAKFIGSPSMNIVEAEYHNGALVIGKQKVELPGYLAADRRAVPVGTAVRRCPPGTRADEPHPAGAVDRGRGPLRGGLRKPVRCLYSGRGRQERADCHPRGRDSAAG